MLFSQTILAWYAANGRSLPWRETNDPYAIWLSEIIMQQTRIAQGQAYWERFIRRWKTVDELAQATEDEVLREWQGLGYYSRARNLHTAARQIAEKGNFPHTYDEIKKLKGIGEYTAAAITSIAFGEPVAVVDGNVYRVLARYFGIETPIDTTQGKKDFRLIAQAQLPIRQPAAYNQGVMDFGALQCKPLSPDCTVCPLCETCVAYRENRVSSLPVKSKRTKQTEQHLVYIYIRCRKHIAIRRRGAGDIWQGLWEFPTAESVERVAANSPWQQQSRLCKEKVKHVLTHRILFADIYLWETDTRPLLPDDYIWIEESRLDDYALPRLMEILKENV